MTSCTCVDCMYGGNVGNEHGGIAPPSSEKGDDEMSEVNPRDFMVGQGLTNYGVRDPIPDSYVMPDDIKRSIGSGGRACGIRIDSKLSYTAYVVKAGSKRRYARTKEKALQIASKLLLCNDSIEIKRTELE